MLTAESPKGDRGLPCSAAAAGSGVCGFQDFFRNPPGFRNVPGFLYSQPNFRLSIPGELLQDQSLIAVQDHAHGPGIDEEQKRIALEIPDPLHIGGTHDLHGIDVLIDDPADVLVRQGLQDDVHVVFALQAEFQYIELQHADDACNDLLHTGIVLLEYLDSALLSDLGDALDELIPLHGIHLPDPGKVLGSEGRDAFIAEILFGGADRVADGIDAGIEHAHDVARVGLGQDLAVAGHQLLGLGQALGRHIYRNRSA